MKFLTCLAVADAIQSEANAQEVQLDIPYTDPAHERQVLDIYSPRDSLAPRNHPFGAC